jgi:hypothetical protein
MLPDGSLPHGRDAEVIVLRDVDVPEVRGVDGKSMSWLAAVLHVDFIPSFLSDRRAEDVEAVELTVRAFVQRVGG